jgi:hypothetical protein
MLTWNNFLHVLQFRVMKISYQPLLAASYTILQKNPLSVIKLGNGCRTWSVHHISVSFVHLVFIFAELLNLNIVVKITELFWCWFQFEFIPLSNEDWIQLSLLLNSHCIVRKLLPYVVYFCLPYTSIGIDGNNTRNSLSLFLGDKKVYLTPLAPTYAIFNDFNNQH